MISRQLETKHGITYWNISSDDEDDILTGSQRSGAFYRDSISGGAGNDTLSGGSGTDTLDGGEGDDRLLGGSGSHSMDGGNGNDTVGGLGGDDTINGGSGNDVIAGGDDDDLLLQSDFTGTDRFDGGRGTDTLDYSDRSIDNGAVHVSLAKGTVDKFLDGVLSATDTIRNVDRFIVTAHNDTLDGNNGANVLDGLLGDDVLNGGDGNDTLAGDFSANDEDPPNAGGNDTLNGGSGNDSLYGGVGNDRFLQNSVFGGDKIDGGADLDTVDYSGLNSPGATGIIASLVTGKVQKFSFGYARSVDVLRNVETLIASDFNDTLTGGGHDNLLAGGAGNDHFAMLVAAGNDTLDGGSGSDKLDYSGDPAAFLNAHIIYATATGLVYELNDLAVKFDLLAGTVSKFHHKELIGTDNFTNIESFVGSGSADTLIGSDGNDLFDGNTGNDVMNGGAGNDVLVGGAGDDIFRQTDLAGSDSFAGASGKDTLDYSQLAIGAGKLSISLASGEAVKEDATAHVAIDHFSGIEKVIGSDSADDITGSANADTLEGGQGNDSLRGGSGSDSVSGGDGDDRLVQGNPTKNDTIGAAVLAASAAAQVEIGWNGDSDTIDGGSGFDTLDYSNFNGGIAGSHVSVNLDAGTATKTYHDGFSVIDTLRSIETVIGTGNGDDLIGSVNPDDLRGGGGNDTLNGGADADKIFGGDGDDLLQQNDRNSNDTFAGGDGADTLDYTLIPKNLGYVTIDWVNHRVHKFSQTEAPLGIDDFSGIETIITHNGIEIAPRERAVVDEQGNLDLNTIVLIGASNGPAHLIG